MDINKTTMKSIRVALLLAGNLLLLNLITTGCSSVVAEPGDVKILRCPQLISSHDGKMFRMILPTTSLGRADTNVIAVRNLPGYLKGQFHYSLAMSGSYEGSTAGQSGQHTQWQNINITVAFRKLDGTEIFSQEFASSPPPQNFGSPREGWETDWVLGPDSDTAGPLPVNEDSFDIVVTVEQPSRTATDKAILTAVAYVKNYQAPAYSSGSGD
ncbi:MAG TPA: hypothetical protein VGO57_14210 [Verrucomicrobiae bacterium]